MSCRQVRFRTSRTHLARVVGAVEPPAGGAANEERDADDEDDGDGDEAADLLRCRDHRRHFREGGRPQFRRERETDCLLLRGGRLVRCQALSEDRKSRLESDTQRRRGGGYGTAARRLARRRAASRSTAVIPRMRGSHPVLLVVRPPQKKKYAASVRSNHKCVDGPKVAKETRVTPS